MGRNHDPMRHPRISAAFCASVAAAWAVMSSWIDGPESLPFLFVQYAAFLVLFAALPSSLRLAWGIVTGKVPTGWARFFLKTAVGYHVLLAVVAAVSGAFLAYNNEIAPARLPLAVLSNGERTVVFRTMAHVATPDFYLRAQSGAVAAQASGAVVFFEGVRPGSPKNFARLQEALGVKFGPGIYEALASLAGVRDQLSFPVVGTASGARENVDLSVDEIMAAYDAAASTGALAALPESTGALADLADLARVAERFGPRQRAALAYAARAALNFVIRNEELSKQAMRREKPVLMAAILDARDKHLAAAILSSKRKDVYAVYGLMHLQGVYDELRKADPRWDIISVTYDEPLR